MIIYPAIDLRKGRCVRLYQGDPEKETIYHEDPVIVAKRWETMGAEWLHVVDLDGAFEGEPIQKELVVKIANSVGIPIQVGGGIRNSDDVEFYLSSGVARVIIGTMALRKPDWFVSVCEKFPKRIGLAIDAREGMVAIKGWKESTNVSAMDIVEKWDNLPIGAIIYTDISRDGTQRGINFEGTRLLVEKSRNPVVASGGVGSIEDVIKLRHLEEKGLDGVIIGRALYSGSVDFKKALEIAATTEKMERRN